MFHLYEFANIIPDSQILGDKDTLWQHISIDSRTIKSGELYIAIIGEVHDGHDFIREACQKGAAAIVLEKQSLQEHPALDKEIEQPLLLVKNTLQALHLWTHYYHSLFKPLDICITGSNGKTTTKEMISHLLSNKYRVLKSKGNYNNEIGVPLTILDLNSECEVMILEMAAQKTGEIRELTKIIRPDIAIITNIGEAHIGLFGNKDNIAREKSELILSLKDRGTAIINRDDGYYDYLVSSVPAHNNIISFGFHPEADVRAKSFYQKDERHLQFELILSKTKESFPVTLPLLGRFNVLNALAAIAVALEMEIPVPEITKVLSNFEGNEWHMEYLLLDKGITLIQDYYNANPTATKEALQSVVMIAQGRYKAAILGDMLELGDGAIDYHKKIGREAATLSCDMLIAIGEYEKYIIQGAREEGMAEDKIISFKKEEKEKLAQWLSESIPENSIVLMKGSRGIQMEKIVQYWRRNTKRKGNHRYA